MSPALPREERDAMVDRATCETAGPVFPDTYTWHYRRDVPALLAALDAAEAENERLRGDATDLERLADTYTTEGTVIVLNKILNLRAERDAAHAETQRLHGLLPAIREGYDASESMRVTAEAQLDEARAALAALEAQVAAGEASDGHHTHHELYDYRMLYNAHAARGWLAAGIPVVKSLYHSDGEPCFGGGWFIVVATLPTGQVSNHYRTAHLGLFADVPTVDLPPEYDGHTPADAANRLAYALAAAPSETEEGR